MGCEVIALALALAGVVAAVTMVGVGVYRMVK
jgi:hypothetical protein